MGLNILLCLVTKDAKKRKNIKNYVQFINITAYDNKNHNYPQWLTKITLNSRQYFYI